MALAVYLSASTARAAELRRYADELKADGALVVSRWHDEDLSLDPGEGASQDLLDLGTADVLVAFTQGPLATRQGRGGRHVEFGVALATQKKLLVVGEREHAFHYLQNVSIVPDWKAAKAALAGSDRA